MNTRKLRKAIMTLCAALLLVSLSVGITVAYLTDTQAVTNTFTVGKVGITLDEADVYEEGDAGVTADKIGTAIPGADRVATNKYNLIPGHVYDKDPTITVNADSQDCYVMAKVTVNVAPDRDLGNLIPNDGDTGLIAYGGIVTGGVFSTTFETVDWDEYGGEADSDDDLVYENDQYKLIQLAGNGAGEARYFYIFVKEPQKATGEPVVLFEKLVIPGEWDHAQMAYLNGLTIDVEAYAVQAEGFTNVEEAIAAGFGDVFEKEY